METESLRESSDPPPHPKFLLNEVGPFNELADGFIGLSCAAEVGDTEDGDASGMPFRNDRPVGCICYLTPIS